LIRVAKKMKDNKMMAVKMGMGIKRILFIFVVLLIVCHLTACGWYLLASLENFHEDTWVVRYSYQNTSTFNVNYESFNDKFTRNISQEDIGALK
jgi:hypothetical protein